LLVSQGEAEVSAGAAGTPVSVGQGMDLPLAAVLVPERSTATPDDTLASWAQGRSESISADNAITAQIDEDPASRPYSASLGGFSYFPLIGATPLGLGSSGLYSSYAPPYQSGFSSIYLPGYTYRPLLLGLRLGSYSGYSGFVHPIPPRLGFSPGVGSIVGAPHATHPPVSSAPAPARPITRGGFHPAHR
jgi:hypothetical protein